MVPTPLDDYLDYYRTMDSPGYAVLVTGPWGSGKTHQVKRALPEDKRLYVSLFGVQTVEQLHAEVIAAATPSMTKLRRLTDSAEKRIRDVGGMWTLGSVVPAVASALLRRDLKPDRTLVFDDLERCALDATPLLGAINLYVEQKNCRVIAIAHDDKLVEEITAKKEKVFGQIIRVEPETADAFESFLRIERLATARDFIASHKASLLEIFAQSKEPSLRVLRQVTEDLSRLHKTLADRHLSHREAMRALVTLFAAFDIEIRGERLSEYHLRDRTIKMVKARQARAEKKVGKTRDHAKDASDVIDQQLLVADEKFPTVDLHSPLLSDELLYAFFIQGRYEAADVRAHLDTSVFFSSPEQTPPWKVVINFKDLEDDVLQSALQRLNVQFDGREVVEIGEMLHIFALRLLMVENDVLEGTLEEQEAACRAYIDDLLNQNRLPPPRTDWHNGDWDNGSYDGYGFWVTSSAKPHFETLLAYIAGARTRAFEKRFSQIADELLTLMKTDAEAFRQRIAPTNTTEGSYSAVAVLHAIEPERFVEAWLAAPRKGWRIIKQGLNDRFKVSLRFRQELADEAPWSKRVYELLLERAAAASGFDALRIRHAVPSTLATFSEPEKRAESENGDESR